MTDRMGQDPQNSKSVPAINDTRRHLCASSLLQADTIIAGVRKHWNAARRDRDLPLRSDVDPETLGTLRDHCFILERLVSGIARFRLAGRQIVDVLGMEPRGMALNALFLKTCRHRVGIVIESVFSVPQSVELQLEAKHENQRSAVRGRMLLLPLRSDFGDVSRALGVIALNAAPSARPHRFGISAEHFYPVLPGQPARTPVSRPPLTTEALDSQNLRTPLHSKLKLEVIKGGKH